MGLYIHIPFCSRKCDYCDFVSYSMDRKAQELYLEALFTEIDMVRSEFHDKIFDTIYIGGGTPSIVYEGFIASLTRKLYSSFHFTDKIEYTIEINPASFTREKFFEYAEAGVNRISVGVQCLDEKLLRENGRLQSVENVEETFKILRDSRFPNVSGDVMIGLPRQSANDVLDTVKFLIDHKVKHISMYALQVEKNTMLYDKIRRGKLKVMPEEKTVKAYNKAYEMLKDAGYVRYEVSNFARPGFESKHNKKYWDNTEFLGLGVSAYSYLDGYRYYNTKRLDTYIDHMQEGKTAVYSKEYVSNIAARTERIMLSLRTSAGLDMGKFKEEFGEDLMQTRVEQIKKLISLNMIYLDGNTMHIKDEYFYVSNSIIVELL